MDLFVMSGHACFCQGGWAGAREAGICMFGSCGPLGGASPLLFVKGFPGRWMQQHPALEQRKSCLSIRAAFDELDFLVEAFDHPVAPRVSASIDHCRFVISQSIDKADEFRIPTGAYRRFPLLPSTPSLTLARDAGQTAG